MKGLFWILLGVVIGLMAAPRAGEATRREVVARVNQLFGSQG